MNWLIPTIVLAVLLIAGAVALARRGGSRPSKVDNAIDLERLRATLESVGVAVGSTDIPDPGLLCPRISLDDQFIDAVPAKRGGKRAVLVLLGDRIVTAESTVGRAGAEVHVLPVDELEDVHQGFEIGGHIEFTTDDGDTLKFTHIPRSQTHDFADALQRLR